MLTRRRRRRHHKSNNRARLDIKSHYTRQRHRACGSGIMIYASRLGGNGKINTPPFPTVPGWREGGRYGWPRELNGCRETGRALGVVVRVTGSRWLALDLRSRGHLAGRKVHPYHLRPMSHLAPDRCAFSPRSLRPIRRLSRRGRQPVLPTIKTGRVVTS